MAVISHAPGVSYWEENTAQHLASEGYAVGGWDCRKFADTRTYRQPELIEGYEAAVEAVRKRSHASEPSPVWYGGWSTGAEQAVAAADSPTRPAQLKGLWLAAPGTRGLYGLNTAYLLGENPTGPDSFSMVDTANSLHGLPLVQFTAGLDPLDDETWIEQYKGPKKVVPLPGLLHDMGQAGETFQKALDEALKWTLQPTQS